MLFLIQYDRSAAKLVSIEKFDDTRRMDAERARLSLELSLHSDGIEDEIVILEAASEEALRKTHRRYFESLEELARAG